MDVSAKVEVDGGARLTLEGSDIHCRLPLQISDRSARRGSDPLTTQCSEEAEALADRAQQTLTIDTKEAA